MLYGRNFDWTYSPALLLFTNPPKIPRVKALGSVASRLPC